MKKSSADLLTFSLHGSEGIDDYCAILDIEKEIFREIEMRRRVYPRWVAANRMTDAEATDRIAVMQKALALVQKVKAHLQKGGCR